MEVMKEPEKQTIEEEEEDTCKLAYGLHFLLGAGNLLPWNTFITAIDYFSYIYPKAHVERVLALAYMCSSVSVLVTLIVSSSKRLPSLRLRMNLGYAVFVVSLMVTPIINWSNWWAKSGDHSFMVSVASVVTVGLAEGMLAGSLIGSAGKLPKQYMQGVFAGTAFSGVFVSLLRVITKAILPATPRGLQTSACLYFIISATILFICMLSSNLLYILPVMQKHYYKVDTVDKASKPRLLGTAKQIVWPSIAMFSIYIITLSIFPANTGDDNLKSKALGDWYPILLIVVYNVTDLAGKSSTALWVPKDVRKVTWTCFARVLFLPAFRVCLHGPKWLNTEVPMIILTSLLASSNGYLTSALMMLTPKTVSLLEAEKAALVLMLSLGLGLFSGSIVGWLWVI